MDKQKIRRLEEVDKPFSKAEKDWIFKNLIQTAIGISFLMYIVSAMITAIAEKGI